MIGIIGFGAFGQLAAKMLEQQTNIVVTDLVDRSKEAKKIGVEFVTLDKAAACDTLIIATPISSMSSVLDSIIPHLQKGALVLDVCSVKKKPADLMLEKLPKDVEIIATHPLFGPQSTNTGKNIVICPIRVKEQTLLKVLDFLNTEGLKVITCTPEEHDLEMAKSQAVCHFLGRALSQLGVTKGKFSTSSFSHLIESVNMVKDDSFELFCDLQNENPFAAEIRKNLIDELKRVNEALI